MRPTDAPRIATTGVSLLCDACGRGTAHGVPCDPLLPWLRPDLTTYPRTPVACECPDCLVPSGSPHHLSCWLAECEHGPWLLGGDACRVDDGPEAA